MRNNGTAAERILWKQLQNKQLNVKFRRQEPIGDYIVDFVSFEKKLIIEIDGGQHSEDLIIDKDNTRTQWLNSQGFEVIRFWNNDVLENLEVVLSQIRTFLDEESPSP